MDDGYCPECGDAFHLDDCGGYNPPTKSGLCRDCDERLRQEDAEYDDGDRDDWLDNADIPTEGGQP